MPVLNQQQTTITKLNGSTGTEVWTKACFNSPQFDEHGTPMPTLVTADATGVYAAYPSSVNNTNEGTVHAMKLNRTTGAIEWVVEIKDHNTIGKSPTATSDGRYTCLGTSSSTMSFGGLTTDAQRLYLSLPRFAVWEGTVPDGGDIWAIDKNGPEAVTNGSMYSITNNAASASSWHTATGINLAPGAIQGMAADAVVSDGSANSYIVDVVSDNVHILPPISAVTTPSLDVVNIARVGQLIVGNKSAPSSANGTPGDKAGMVRPSADGIWYCTGDYTDGSTAIWRMAASSSPTAGKFKAGLVGFNPTLGTMVGCPGDVAGDIRLVGNRIFYCTGTYDGVTSIWTNTIDVTNGSGIQQTSNMSWDYTNDPDYPSGAVVTNYTRSFYSASASALSIPQDIRGDKFAKPAAGEYVLQYRATRSITLQMNGTPYGWYATTPATSPATFRLSVNGINFSTISFPAGGNTPNSWSNFIYTINPGDVFRIQAPMTQDATLAGLSFAIPATVDISF